MSLIAAPTADIFSTRETDALLAHARALQQAAQAGAVQPLLKGKKLGLLCEAVDDPDAALFRRAAGELGAHVAHIRPSLTESSAPQDVKQTAHMLGRLYDAVECQGVASSVVRLLTRDAGIPVYEGIATHSHPTARLAGLLEGDGSAVDQRRFVLQAVLLSTVGC